jgi:hypothetical protein
MYERVTRDKEVESEESPPAPDTFVIERHLVQSQDLEHQPRPDTRVSNTGVTVTPPVVDDPRNRDVEKEETAAQETQPGQKPG